MDRGHKQGCSRLENSSAADEYGDSVIECVNTMDGKDGQEKVQGIETYVRILCYPPYHEY